jgi:dinuclear metal center YbgI/SA1388 family protein
MPSLDSIAAHLDALLRVREIPDYPPALNGVQLANTSDVVRVAAAVDLSRRTIEGAIAEGANLLLVHHGMFWGGLQPIRGPFYERVALLLRHDIAVYAAHLPLDAHQTLGNNVLLARELGLEPSAGFARYQTVDVGVQGSADVTTAELVERTRRFARTHGGEVRTSDVPPGRRTRRWAICTGAGASADTLRECVRDGIDTLVVGEGPHWTAVDAAELGLAIIYAGHYATETLGVRALAAHVAETFGVPWTFIDAPTGL